MNIKPLNDTSTINLVTIQGLPTKNIVRKQQNVETRLIMRENSSQNVVSQILQSESKRQLFIVMLSLIIGLTCISLIAWMALATSVSWAAYIIPVLALMFATYNFGSSFFEHRLIKSSMLRHREDVRVGLTTTPIFINKLYKNIQVHQVTHNWLTGFALFYGGILTLLLWWLKDVSWWIFDFKSWINSLFWNADTMTWIMTGLLIFIVVLYIALSISRKKRIATIESMFGTEVYIGNDVENAKKNKSAFYMQLFKISLFIFLIIPTLVWILMKVLPRR